MTNFDDVKIAIRVDASSVIGSGHVMRCLALADALKRKGAKAHFICRVHENNLIGFIRDKKYDCSTLDLCDGAGDGAVAKDQEQMPEHASWLGTSWQRDAEETGEVLKRGSYDWLLVDHYALDWHWESALRPLNKKIMVIDDLADRKHDCDALLDSVCGRKPEHYRDLAPSACHFLLGSQFALLRPEFAELRPTALQRRGEIDVPRRFLVTLGGMDPDNLTGTVLEQLAQADLPADSEVEVILGAGFSHVEQVKGLAGNMPVKTSVSVGVENMAERMASADFAITAGGVSAIECCCLGLPAIVIVTAKNQLPSATALEKGGISKVISSKSLASDFLPAFSHASHDLEWYQQAVSCGSQLIDGGGATRAVEVFTEIDGRAWIGAEDQFPCSHGKLHPVTDSDLENIRRWRNHPRVREAMITQHEISLQEHLAWWQKTRDDDTKRWYIYMGKDTPAAVVYFFHLDAVEKVGWWGFYLCDYSKESSVNRRTLARRVVKAMIEHAFNEMGLDRLLCEARESNVAAISLYKEFGFVESRVTPSRMAVDLTVMELKKTEG